MRFTWRQGFGPRILRRAALVGALSLLAVQPGSARTAAPTCLGLPATIVGQPGPSIEGTPGNDVIVGTSGGDKIYGNGGNDVICGGDGNDFIQAFNGDDRVDGGNGDDQIVGGGGNDQLDGGANTAVGDTVVYLNAPAGVNVSLVEGIATGGAGTDQLSGFEGVFGSKFDDTLTGGPTDNFFIPSDGNDVVVGGGGLDAVLFSASRGVNVNLAQGRANGEGTDTLRQINAVVGTDANDTITGDAGQNFLFGAAGADRINGGGGRDLIVGDFQDEPSGNDQLRGGAGDDFLVGAAGNDVIDGGPGRQDTAAYWYANGVSANLAKHVVTGEGRDRLRGIEGIIGSPGNDSITGDARADLLSGQSGDDTISGAGADDFLDGGAGDDTLKGGRGTDYCVSGESPSSCEITGFAFAGLRRSAAAKPGQVDYGERPTCVNVRGRAASAADRKRRRHVASASPPDRVVPPVHRFPLVPAAAQDVITWQPTLYRYARSHGWRVFKRLPALTTVVSTAGVTLWSSSSGGAVSQVSLTVPAGRYAWRARVHFGTGESRTDAIEPHVNLNTGAKGLFQQACRF
jgi:Ca2+-binding RTX toxin-like protein